jgi:hypothetical protein
MFTAYEGMEVRKIKKQEKQENVIQNKIQDFKTTIFFQKENFTIILPVQWEACENSTLLSLCLAKGAVGV